MSLQIEAFLIFAIAAFMQVQLPLVSTDGELCGLVFGIGSLVVVIFLPVVFIYYLSRDKMFFYDKEYQITWGRLSKDLRQENKWQISSWFVFVIRRLVMAVSCFVLPFGCFQLVIMLSMNIATTSYLVHHKPQESKFKNRVELLNEFFIAIASYHMILFTDWIPDHHLQYNLGWSMIINVAACFVINILIFLYFVI